MLPDRGNGASDRIVSICGNPQQRVDAKTPHQRLKWKAEDFFQDAGVVSLCKAIEAKDTEEIERLVKSEHVNAKGVAT